MMSNIAIRPRNGGPAGARRLRVIVLPNKRWKSAPDDQQHSAPDPDRLRMLLEQRGIDIIVRDPFLPPYNPWGRSHPFFAGLDPLRALTVLLRDRSADLVVSVFESGSVFLLLLRRMLFFKPPVVLWDVSVGSIWRPRRMALNLVLPRIDGLFSLTCSQRTATADQYRIRATSDVVGYGVDEAFYHPDFNRGADYVLSVGDDPARDYRTLVAAVRDLPISVVLKSQIQAEMPAGSAARIKIIRNNLSFVELRALYAVAAIVVVPLKPSDNPSGITALFEAMAMGKPIIATDLPMIREFIISGHSGLTVPVGDPNALRDAISYLLARPDERERLGRNARLHLEAHHTEALLADRLAASMRRVAQPSSSRGT